MDLLTTLMAFLLALGTLIFVHEFGHYQVAKWCGVKVLRFSLGFGKPLLRWVRGTDKTEWVISAIPFGGYVKMLDERETEVPIDTSELPRAFNRQKVWKRFCIVAAGPLANLILAVLLYTALNIAGMDEPVPILAKPEQGTIAEQAGLVSGDTITGLTINGQQHEVIRSWNDLRWQLLNYLVEKKQLTFDVQQEGGQTHQSALLDLAQFDSSNLEGDFMHRLGLELAKPQAILGEIVPGSSADEAGLKSGDRIEKINDADVPNGTEFVKQIRANPGQELQLTVTRTENGDVRQLRLVVTPKAADDKAANGQVQRIGRIGAAVGGQPKMVNVSYSPMEAFDRAFSKTWEMSVFSVKMMGRMLVGDISWRNLSGPVTIADYAGQSARLGMSYYVGFIALISISLGVLNLMPVPVLDGGHLLYYCVEILFGRPIPEIWLERFQRVGLVLILVMMGLAMFNDISKLVG
ncbi:RIP metalloprotease RseP [Ampullimonas aquatilis]|uniref:RIP metalloprotease RseP n=1 Tax=Ampullimonas aquatilis TaxID=1341549 RepID=UPI003C782625